MFRTARDPASRSTPESRADLFGAHFATWRKKHASHPIYIPSEFGFIKPRERPRLERSTIHGLDARPNATKADRHTRGCAAAELKRVFGAPDDGASASPNAATETNGDLKLLKEDRPPEITFNEDTWVTTVRQELTFVNVSQAKFNNVVTSADPRYWDDFAEALFESTTVGKWDPKTGTFQSAETLEPGQDPRELEKRLDKKWNKERGGQIEERVVWSFNGDTNGGAVNVLEIFDVTPADEVERTKTYRYGYRLLRCIEANFVGSFQPGGLDIDEGLFSVNWASRTRELTVVAQKSLHYCSQPNTPRDLDRIMNLMAPALLSMFMRQLTLHGVAGVLRGTIKRRPSISQAITPKAI